MRDSLEHPAMTLAHMPLCLGLSKPSIDDLMGRLRFSKHRSGDVLVHRRDATSDIYFLLSGEVSVKSFSSDGQEVAFRQIGAPSVFGEFAAIDGQTRSADVTALNAIEVGRMSGTDFQALILAHPQLGLNLAAHLVAKIRGLSERVFEFGAYSVPVRVRRALLRLAENSVPLKGVVTIKPAPTHYELSAMLSTHREAVSRELARLARRGVIRTGRQTIAILDMQALTRIADLGES